MADTLTEAVDQLTIRVKDGSDVPLVMYLHHLREQMNIIEIGAMTPDLTETQRAEERGKWLILQDIMQEFGLERRHGFTEPETPGEPG